MGKQISKDAVVTLTPTDDASGYTNSNLRFAGEKSTKIKDGHGVMSKPANLHEGKRMPSGAQSNNSLESDRGVVLATVKMNSKDRGHQTINSKMNSKDRGHQTMNSKMNSKDRGHQTMNSKDRGHQTMNSKMNSKDRGHQTLNSKVNSKDRGPQTRLSQTVVSLSPTPVKQQKLPDPNAWRNNTSPRLVEMKKIPGISGHKLKEAQTTAEKAVKQGKIFAINGQWPSVLRKALKDRGWVEKLDYGWLPIPPIEKKKHGSGGSKDNHMNNSSTVNGIMSQMVKNCSPTFIWCVTVGDVDYSTLNREQIVNHYSGVWSFTTKVGLYKNIRNVTWFDNVNSMAFFPRCYELRMADEKTAFIDDFRLTACQSIIRHVIERYGRQSSEEGIDKDKKPSQDRKTDRRGGNKSVEKKNGTSGSTTPPSPQPSRKETPVEQVEVTVVDQAIRQCRRWLGLKTHLDIDRWDDPYLLSDSVWDQIIQSHYRIVSGATIKDAASRVEMCEEVAGELRKHNPQFGIDGTQNVWIIKPGAQSRGQGILLSNNLEEMCKMSRCMDRKIFQKYIERPLLVYNTKFDIRQWFLVTDWNPLTIWYYKECYLRFCSQQFSLGNFDRAIHLSNNAIQKHCTNGPRSTSLPENNMWDLETFKQFLSEQGQGQMWADKIYPGMKEALTGTLLSVQEEVKGRKESFELFGADFMLTEDFNPWLIEINSNPDLSASTAITKRLCHNVIEDTLKVVIDRKYDRNCSTGDFESVWKQNPVTVAGAPYVVSLSIEGRSIRKK